MCGLKKGYVYIGCPKHINVKFGQIKESADLDKEILFYCKSCKDVIQGKKVTK